MRRPMIAGNWKMYGNRVFAQDLLTLIRDAADSVPKPEIVVLPPFVFLEQARRLLEDSRVGWGAQNVYPALDGAYTGEISPLMLKEFGCQYVLVGHSERRHLFGETDQQVATKFNLAGMTGLKPILCVGETREQRDAEDTFRVIAQQLAAVTCNADGLHVLENAVIAYEPVWAIGTGLTASPEQAQEVHRFIRQEVEKINKTLAEKVRILYGGSVKQNNAAALFAMPDIDGGLIGGASLNGQEFLEIAKLCS